MNWDAIGAIGEMVSAVAVFFSLFYLANQIRVSNRASTHAAEQHVLDNQRIWSGRIADSDSLSTIWLKGSRDKPELTESEWVRFGTLCQEVTLGWERGFLLEVGGDVSTTVLERETRMRKLVLGSRGYRKWFMARKLVLRAEFAALLGKELAPTRSRMRSHMPVTVQMRTKYNKSGLRTPKPLRGSAAPA
jgi:hypothetical protein